MTIKFLVIHMDKDGRERLTYFTNYREAYDFLIELNQPTATMWSKEFF